MMGPPPPPSEAAAASSLSEPGCTLNGLSDLLDTMSSSNKAAAAAATSSPPPSTVKNATTASTSSANNSKPATAQQQQQQHTFADLYDKDVRLRSGSYGTVYTCRHKLHQKDTTYAVKIMDRQKLKASALDSIYREVRILHELTQAAAAEHHGDDAAHYFGVIPLVDFFVEPANLYMVQVYARGGDVFDRLTSRRVYTERDARALAKRLLETIQLLHARGIVHRDLKPENLLLLDAVDDSSILVADFGFARHLKKDETCLTRCG